METSSESKSVLAALGEELYQILQERDVFRDEVERVQRLLDFARAEIKWLRETGLAADKGDGRTNRRKLDRYDADEIRSMWVAGGYSKKDLADYFQVHPSTVSRIISGCTTVTERFTFQPWPKLPRLNREIIITEKIDGTNAAIQFDEDGNWAAQSRKRLIQPGKDTDNYGFAAWVDENHEDLFVDLGPGIHFGEWWGKGILRNYGLDHRRFSLFNTSRWAGVKFVTPHVQPVPILYRGPFRTAEITLCGLMLLTHGSVAEPGFTKPEGLVVFHTAANQMFKVTLEDDDNPKSVLPGRGESLQ